MAFPYTKQTWTDGAGGGTPLSAARWNVMEAGIELAGVKGTSSSPPGSPTDGMIWRYPGDGSNGVYWFFQYDSSQSTNKWVLMGGPPLYVEVTTSENVASTSYVDLSTVGPSYTIGRSGDYLLSYGARVNLTGTNSLTVLVAPKIGSAATSDADAALASSPGVAGAHVMHATTTRTRRKALAAGDVVKLQYRGDAATSTAVLDRWLSVLPIAVI
jgi:hypothetical protein